MKRVNVDLEIGQRGTKVFFNLIFLDTGEIRQKTRSFQWLLDRVLFHEVRTRGETYDLQNVHFIPPFGGSR